MEEDTNGTPLDEEYQEVEREFWQEFGEAPDDNALWSSGSQYRTVFKRLIPRIRRSAEKDGLSANKYYWKLDEAKKIVDDIAFALSSGWRDEEPGWIWFNPTLDCLKSRPDSWSDASPVNKDYLDDATARYLRRPWMQLNLLDWYILNGYIFDELARLNEAMKSGEAIGIINLAYLFSGGNLEKAILWRIGFNVSKFVARWILGPIIIVFVYYIGYQETAIWTAGAYGIYILVHIALFPRRYLRRRALRKEYLGLEKKLHALVGVYQSSSVGIFNPSRLRDLVANTEKEEMFFRPAVYSILDRAIERDPAVFAVEG